ncbi:hypothetical protein [Salinadaptatus halalkaliphilus]|uniref:hypothetical protein n=1 Tax=Salinadaptatus halalkaliphilus TaxID=2419781 RepID=UPI001144C504|nr:hypothetical protein [Salinadaptatus halalkaliphilus]
MSEILGRFELNPNDWGDYVRQTAESTTPTIPPNNSATPNSTDCVDEDNVDPSTLAECANELADRWEDVDFTETNSDTWPPTLHKREQWMGRQDKLPFAPWGDYDHPEADPDEDARWKWGLEENYVDGETVAIAEDDPRLDGRVFIQLEDDPYAFVDGDDIRCPETGEVHPAFVAILEHLGATYADVSTSGSGVHAYYRGELPIDGTEQATFALDSDPWGKNDDVPTVEIYANKHVNVATGEHVEETPLEVAKWDTDVLRTILKVNGYEDQESVEHDTDRERPELKGYNPDSTSADETTADIRDVLATVDNLEPSDVRLRTRQTGEESTGWSTWDPSYRASASGESLHYNGEGVFHDHKENEAFGVLGLIAVEEDIISNPWDRLTGAEWWNAVEAARDRGAPIPELDRSVGQQATEPTTVLPSEDILPPVTAWDWEAAGARAAHGELPEQDTLDVDDVRERTVETIADGYKRGDRRLVEVLPTGGKSFGSIEAAARTSEPITYLTGRGRKEQYDQIAEWCREHGLTYKILPAFTRDCPTASGEHGEDWKETVLDWYNRGATPQDIHKYAEDILDRPLPCQVGHDENHVDCPYARKWDFDPETDGSADPDEDLQINVLIGHYTHAHREDKVVHGRTVVFDEFPGGAYERTLDHGIEGAVTYYLQSHDAIPFDHYTELLEGRDDDARRANALTELLDHRIDPDGRAVLKDDAANAAAPLAAFTLLAAAENNLGNGLERAEFAADGHDNDDSRVGLHDREEGTVRVLAPPDLSYARGVVALDGTPTKSMWELVLGERLNHRQILTDDERRDYLRDALDLNLVRTSEYVKPYNSADHVAVNDDAALLEAITERHDEDPSVITSMTALQEYECEGVLSYNDNTGEVLEGPADQVRWYGNVLGSNEFKHKRVGAVIGSTHYGDRFIQKWGAYAGEAVERNDEKGAELSYGEFGDDVLQHMREHTTLQSVMRFGRDGEGAVVYVHTDTLPEWVEPVIAAEGRVIRTRSEGEQQVIKAATDLHSWQTAEIAEHPIVNVGKRQVFNILNDLADHGYLQRESDGRGYVWYDDGLHRINDHGDVELEPVELDGAEGANEVEEIARRKTIYTWDFRNSPCELTSDPADSLNDIDRLASEPATGGDRPPDSID